jgi:periplasmic divalent cation tolerance protein
VTEGRLVLTTAPDMTRAQTLVDTLVEERLVACGSLLPGMLSTYRWNDAVQRETEVLVLLKTTAARAQAVLERVPQLHPHEVPEVLVLPVEAGHGPYLEWVRRESSVEVR